ncbi:hypothetical protein Q3G72_005977 [Acer saccharum]|nr:hypothetical protein Q3G72_005977 [Acer saccharum]
MEIQSEPFVFSAQQPPACKMNVDVSPGNNDCASAKRARANDDILGRNDIGTNQHQKNGNSLINIEDLSSDSVLCQAQHEPNIVSITSSVSTDVVKCVNNPVMQHDNSFEVIAFELVEAMALVSE